MFNFNFMESRIFLLNWVLGVEEIQYDRIYIFLKGMSSMLFIT